jgi:hypothetical protein
MDINQIITEVAIALKTDKSLDKLIVKYGEDDVNTAMHCIAFEEQEDLVEEDWNE